MIRDVAYWLIDEGYAALPVYRGKAPGVNWQQSQRQLPTPRDFDGWVRPRPPQASGAGSGAAAELAAIQAAAVADTNDLLDTSSTNPDVTVVTATDSQGRLYADVTVQYTFTTIFDWPGLPHSIDLERTVRARVAE